jgi:hypothetical protein
LTTKEIFSGFLIDWTEDWILIKNNPVDFIIDGDIEKQNVKAIIKTRIMNLQKES